MSIANRINKITKHLENDYINIEALVGEVSEDKNIENIAPILDTLWEELPKVTGEHTSLNLNNTKKGKTKLTLKGNTYQDGEPTPDAPQEVEVVTGENEVEVCGKNMYAPNLTFSTGANKQNIRYEMSLQPNTKYTFTSTHSFTGVYLYDESGVRTRSIGNVSQLTTISFTTTSSEVYGGFEFFSGISNVDVSTYDFTGVQLEVGDTSTTYEAYKGQTYKVNLGRYVPVGYTQVDYIENSGTQFIDTGFKPNQDTSVEMEVLIPQNSAEITRFFETRNTTYVNKSFGILNFRDYNNILQFRYDIQFAKNNYKLDVETKYKIRTNKNNVYVNDEWIFNANPSSFQTNYNLALFGFANNSDNVADSSTYRLYSFKLYDNGVLIRDYVPCYRNSDNEVGLYDFVNKVFYTNSGTGAFTYGNVVPNTSIELCKIGTYQDKFYKSNGNWFLHKEIGKVVLDGSETYYYNSVINSMRYTAINDNLINGAIATVISNNFVGVSYNGRISITTPRIYFENHDLQIRSSGFTNVNDFKIWLSTHNTIVNYVLATPTETQITDTTLVNQLEAVWRANSYDNQTNVSQTNSSLPFIISASALEKLSS